MPMLEAVTIAFCRNRMEPGDAAVVARARVTELVGRRSEDSGRFITPTGHGIGRDREVARNAEYNERQGNGYNEKPSSDRAESKQ